MRLRYQSFRSLGLLLVPVFLAAVIAGCGSSSSSSGSSTESTTTVKDSSSSEAATYKGPELELPHEYAKPNVEKNVPFTVGFSNLNGSEATINLIQSSAEEEAKALGGKFIADDAAASITTQVNQVNQMLAQGVNALVIFPIDPTSLAPSLKTAEEKGVPAAAISAPPVAGEETLPGYVTNMIQGSDQAAFCAASSAAKAAPGSTFATMGDSIPVPNLKYLVERYKYWGEKEGLKYLGNVDTQGDSPNAGATAMSTILTKYPEVENVFTWNDTGAQAAATTVRSQNKSVNIVGVGGYQTTMQMVEQGEMLADFRPNWEVLGKELVRALYNQVTHQNMPLPKQTSAIGTCVTKENVSSATPVD